MIDFYEFAAVFLLGIISAAWGIYVERRRAILDRRYRELASEARYIEAHGHRPPLAATPEPDAERWARYEPEQWR